MGGHNSKYKLTGKEEKIKAMLEPVAASALSLRLYRVRALHPQEAHEMWALLRELPARAGLPATPVPHYVPSAVVNAFATGIEAGGIDRPHRWPAAQPEPTRAGGCARARGRAHR